MTEETAIRIAEALEELTASVDILNCIFVAAIIIFVVVKIFER